VPAVLVVRVVVVLNVDHGCIVRFAGRETAGLRTPMSDICVTMSDMVSQRITVRVPANLGNRLRYSSRAGGQTPSDLVRVALENYLGEERGMGSAYEVADAAGLIGCVRRAPKDLSTNRQHFKGFGSGK
jgi:predicted DNA-binding protein